MTAEQIAAGLTKADIARLRAWLNEEIGEEANSTAVIICTRAQETPDAQP